VTDESLVARLVAATCATIERHADELTALDQAIGDGDHGTNLKRGFKAISEEAGDLVRLDFGAALRKAGMVLVMKVGGASGPLFGLALMDMGKVAADRPRTGAQAAALLQAAVDAVKKRGKSDAGAKTMLDVLVPVQAAVADGSGIAAIRTAADAALEATRPMRATKGRAAFLGERSIGHLDPGARSTALLVHAVCDVLEGK
jgi:dihydroxyacetone kinase-like protein